MKSEFFSENNSQHADDGRRMLEEASKKDPRITGLLSRLTEADRRQLMDLLNDPAQTRRILATEQAQALMRTLLQGEGGSSNNGAGGD